ncbi:hypothetical protein DL764_002896 [Monosporascus ibericus]|uniref:G domain-containing protein n=1 Tax=Monosporascus ibericus TaxID=155417 RepID=A0A4Q4TJV4_9PEZI|nr:hypothetical protein DL764_002896 [Monosporascus ibericus]
MSGVAKPMVNDSQDGFKPRRFDIIVAVMRGTQKVDMYICHYKPDSDVYLIDTPGFDDSNRSDTDLLMDIATWLTKSYARKIQLNGMLYMHRITDLRMGGSARKNLFMFKQLCGPKAIQIILFVTTMWENADPQAGNHREQELINTEDSWGLLLRQGARISRHKSHHNSDMRLLEHFVNKKKAPMAIQSEMVDDEKELYETTAEEVAEKIEKIRMEREELKVSMQKMHETSAEKVKQPANLLEDQKQEHAKENKRLQDKLERDEAHRREQERRHREEEGARRVLEKKQLEMGKAILELALRHTYGGERSCAENCLPMPSDSHPVSLKD